jgi:hypothetical protein
VHAADCELARSIAQGDIALTAQRLFDLHRQPMRNDESVFDLVPRHGAPVLPPIPVTSGRAEGHPPVGAGAAASPDVGLGPPPAAAGDFAGDEGAPMPAAAPVPAAGMEEGEFYDKIEKVFGDADLSDFHKPHDYM